MEEPIRKPYPAASNAQSRRRGARPTGREQRRHWNIVFICDVLHMAKNRPVFLGRAEVLFYQNRLSPPSRLVLAFFG
jgi:hypothetical protein